MTQYYYAVTHPTHGLMDDGYIQTQYMDGLSSQHAAHGYTTTYFPLNNSIH